MYRIQAYNIPLQRIEVIYADNMDERNKIMRELQANPDYGLVTFEHLSRGYKCY